jgi:transposase
MALANSDFIGRLYLMNLENDLPIEIPSDIAELKDFALSILFENNLLKKENKNLKALAIDLEEKLRLQRLKKYAPTSEKTPDQYTLGFFNEAEEIVATAQEESDSDDSDPTEEKEKKKRKAGAGRKPLSKDLPREDLIIDLSAEEKEKILSDGNEITKISEEVCEKLKYQPAKISVIRIIRPVYKITSIKTEVEKEPEIITPKMPPSIIDKGIVTPELLAVIATNKYYFGLPLYRQENYFKMIDASISRQSMASWIIEAAKKITPIYNLLQELLLIRTYMQMDETTIQVLNEENKKATTKSYMWVRHSFEGAPIILFDYYKNRSGDVPLELLRDFKGHLQVDGYDGYNKAIKEYNLIRLGCLDHSRRKFFDAAKVSFNKKIAKRCLVLIDKLYEVEREIEGKSVDEITEIRQRKSKILFELLDTYINEQRPKIPPQSVLGKAISYFINEKEFLERYLENGRFKISNVFVENKIRPFSIGRKNWLFSSSVDGANASAMFYSLIETAKANGINPEEYLTVLFTEIPKALQKPDYDYESLLPLKTHYKF